MELKCISCKRGINGSGAVSFNCPSCNKFQINRCRHCREIASRYTCEGCEFSGPN